MRLIPGPRTVDDAFITFRYARNLLAGHGLVYNPGEWVLGTTTPLYALLLSALGLVSGGADANFPIIALFINSIFDALTCYILIRIGESLNSSLAGTAAALIWAVAPMSVTFSIGGLETSLLVLSMTAAGYMHLKQRSVLTGFFASLCVLTRPDALIFVLLLASDRFLRLLRKDGAKPSWAELFAISIPLAIWVVASTAAYGSPVPQSMTAKTYAYLLPRDAALIRLLQHYATPFFGHQVLGIWWIGLGLLLYPTLAITGWLRAIRKENRAWPLAVYPAFYFFVFAFANPLIFRWYLTPPLPMYFMGIFLGLFQISQQTRQRWICLIMIAITLTFTLNAWTLSPDHGPDRPAPEMAFIKLESLYREAAEQLPVSTQPRRTLAAGDIGVLGYETNLPMLDTVGLISPQSTGYYPLPEDKHVINYAIPTALILEEEPDHIVVLEVYVRETLLKDQTFDEVYELAHTLDTEIYGSRGMLIFHKRR